MLRCFASMSETPPPFERDLKRYKGFSASHFSKARFYFQLFVLRSFVLPFLILKYHPKRYGLKYAPKTGPFIVAANHISMLDPPLVSYAVNYPIAYMAKKELFQNFWAAEFYRSQGCFALDRDNPDSATLKTAFNVLKSPAKWALGLFPEGTRSTTGEVLPLKKGIGGLAQKTNTPILPVGIYRDENNRFVVTVGEMITDVSDAEKVQEKVYEALVHLTDPSWKRED